MANDRLRQLYPWADEEYLATIASRSDPAGLLPHQRALLDTIAGPESAGRYNVIYGGKRFSDYSQHPGIAVPIQSGPNVGKTSSAAGRYQFIGPTWKEYQQRLGLPDFSPVSQDRAAWALARDAYGGDLDAALLSGDPATLAAVGQKLSGTWTSLPGGIEQGTSTNRFVNAYNSYLGNPAVAQTAALEGATSQAMNIAANTAAMTAANQGVANQLAAMQQAAIPSVSPFAGLLQAISASQPQHQNVVTKKDAIEPGIGGSRELDPVQATIATSQTPDAYLRRRERLPYSFRI